jgi:hypothetical protein
MRKKPNKTAGAEPDEKRTRRQLIDEAIEDAMRPYAGVLPASGLQIMRDILEDALATHPVAVEALDEMTGGKSPGQSGTRTKGEDDGEEPPGDDGEGGVA